jgi:hypothetical protein
MASSLEAERFTDRLTAAVAGVLFVTMAVLLILGFRGMGFYPLAVRLVLALLLVSYGAWRVVHAWRRAARRGEN